MRHQQKSFRITILTMFFFAFVGCSPTRFFYFPNNHLYQDPETVGMKYDLIAYPSLNGKILYSIFFKTTQTPKGTVVHLHGNFGNVSNHYRQSMFLLNEGFDVLVVDYQGYGASHGSPNPKLTVEDGQASARWAHNYARDPQQTVFIFGQSLGASVAAVVAAKEPSVKAVVLEAGFTSYRTMARVVIKKNALLWLLYPVYPFFISHTYDPINFIDQISPRPTLILHGDQDSIVPVTMAQKLFDRAKEPKSIEIFHGVGHLELRKNGREFYEKRIVDFLNSAAGINKTN